MVLAGSGWPVRFDLCYRDEAVQSSLRVFLEATRKNIPEDPDPGRRLTSI